MGQSARCSTWMRFTMIFSWIDSEGNKLRVWASFATEVCLEIGIVIIFIIIREEDLTAESLKREYTLIRARVWTSSLPCVPNDLFWCRKSRREECCNLRWVGTLGIELICLGWGLVSLERQEWLHDFLWFPCLNMTFE